MASGTLLREDRLKGPTPGNGRPSTLGAHVTGRRAGQRFDAENGVDTEALVLLGDLDPEAIGPNLAHATHYEPTPVDDFERLVGHIPFPLSGATFVDVGAGMGRAVFLAARRPFRQVIGIEISPALTAIAHANLARVRRSSLHCRDVRLVCRDAASYHFPTGDLVVYLYNPFDAELLAQVVMRLVRRGGGNLAIVYHTPIECAVIEASGAFEVIAVERCGIVYRRGAP